MSSDPEPVALKHINAAGASIANDGSSLDEETRKKTLNAARELVKSLEKPFEVLWRYSYRVTLLLRPREPQCLC